MKAAVLTGLGQLEIVDMAVPEIVKDDDVLLKIALVGVCGSDVHYYETGRIGSQVVQYPYRVGHECSAIVAGAGKAVDKLKVGDEVVVDPAAPCHNCDQCAMGRENTCRNLSFLGTPGQGHGCLCEYIVISAESCFAIGGKITLAQGVLCEPFAIGVYSVRQGALSANAKIAILGAGPIGLSCMAAAKAEGAGAIYMTDKIDTRINVAKNAGATWVSNPDVEDIVSAIQREQPLGLDAVFECAGEQGTIDQAVEILRPGGRLVLVGILREDRVEFDIEKIRRKELTIVNIRRQNGCTQHAIDLIADGKVDIDFMITHRFSLEQTKEAFDMVANYNDGVIKAMIEI